MISSLISCHGFWKPLFLVYALDTLLHFSAALNQILKWFFLITSNTSSLLLHPYHSMSCDSLCAAVANIVFPVQFGKIRLPSEFPKILRGTGYFFKNDLFSLSLFLICNLYFR